MKKVAIIQARMTSTRLPGKILMDLAGAPMLVRQIERLRRARLVDEICIATTRNAADDPVVSLAESLDLRWYRGDEDDVLGRYQGAAQESRAEVVVRITADCPLLMPEVVDRVVVGLLEEATACDYAANVIRRTYPRGLDTEAMFRDVLERIARMGKSARAREHVTQFLLTERPDLFVIHSIEDAENNADLRWTVDHQADLDMVRQLYAALPIADGSVGYRDILSFVREHPEISGLNSHLEQ